MWLRALTLSLLLVCSLASSATSKAPPKSVRLAFDHSLIRRLLPSIAQDAESDLAMPSVGTTFGTRSLAKRSTKTLEVHASYIADDPHNIQLGNFSL